MVKKRKEKKSEDVSIINIPTLLNISRIILTFVVIYMVITNRNVVNIVIVFVIAALTDWFDGAIARKYNLVNDFGRKADMVADRFLWIGTALAILFVLGSRGSFSTIYGVQLLLIMIREIITAPSAIVASFSGRGFPHARYVAKVTTFAQGFAISALLLGIFYPNWIYLSLPLSMLTGIVGTISGFYYIKDVQEIQDGK